MVFTLRNGLCSLIYAIAMQSPVLGVFYMMLFGLGTVPMMTAVVYANCL
jgi:sulfite exporter TauE/SafE